MASDNPYASPQSGDLLAELASSGAAQGAWRAARLLVVAEGVELPERCVKCNSPTYGYRKQLRLSWHSPLVFLALLGGLLPYIIVAIILTKRVTVHVGVCQRHARRRLIGIVGGWLGFLFGLLLLLGGATARAPAGAWAFVAGMMLILLSLIGGMVLSRVVWPQRIRDNLAWLKGIDPQYLAAFPEYPGPG